MVNVAPMSPGVLISVLGKMPGKTPAGVAAIQRALRSHNILKTRKRGKSTDRISIEEAAILLFATNMPAPLSVVIDVMKTMAYESRINGLKRWEGPTLTGSIYHGRNPAGQLVAALYNYGHRIRNESDLNISIAIYLSGDFDRVGFWMEIRDKQNDKGTPSFDPQHRSEKPLACSFLTLDNYEHYQSTNIHLETNRLNDIFGSNFSGAFLDQEALKPFVNYSYF